MKSLSYPVIIIISLLIINSCGNKGTSRKELQVTADTTTVPDTGYTGIKQYMSNRFLVKEVTFKNGIREGLMKSFYQSGKLRQTFWYKNGLREDSARWYFEEGQVFRSTPYKKDTVDGIQIQYYRNGKVKARIGYKKGFRTPFFEEYDMNGKLVSGYPELQINTSDEYKTKGLYRITLGLSNKSTNVKYYRGDFSNGIFDTAHCEKIKSIKGIGSLDLKKAGSQNKGSVGIIADILTNFGNRYLVHKKVDLPYNDVK